MLKPMILLACFFLIWTKQRSEENVSSKKEWIEIKFMPWILLLIYESKTGFVKAKNKFTLKCITCSNFFKHYGLLKLNV